MPNRGVMEKKAGKKPGPKDRSYVNKSEKYEVKHEADRQSPAKKFGKGTDE
jgi:hypothetical protein